MLERDITSTDVTCLRRTHALSISYMTSTIPFRSLWRVGKLASGFLAGQGSISVLQAACGLLLVRRLSVEAFAIFTIAITLLTLVRLGSDLGCTHALIALGSPYRADAARLGSLFAAVNRLVTYQFVVAALIVAVLAVPIAWRNDWPVWTAAATIGVVLLIGWVSVYSTVAVAIINIDHDSRGAFTFGMADSGTRLLATLGCLLWPYPVVALIAVLVGAISGRIVVARRVASRIDRKATPSSADIQALRHFTRPLIAGVIFFALQGQLSIFILSAFGYSQAIAEVGALSRLAQFISLLATLNVFFVQPHFARISQRKIFFYRLLFVMGILLILSAALLVSAYVTPDLWLIILGKNYANLQSELPLVILGSVASLFGGTLYSVAISRGVTSGQYWAIVPGLTGQVAFITVNGVSTTSDALILNLIPAAGYAAVQAILLLQIIRRWPSRAGQAAGGSV